MSQHPWVVVITGPTAVGKTELALALAPRVDAEVISADSRQVYRYLDIGTGKPTLAQRAAVPHHLVDVAYPDNPYSVAAYRRDAQQALQALGARERVALVVGGSPHYLQVLMDQFEPPPRNLALRRWLERADQRYPGELDRWIALLDSASAGGVHPRNRRRLLRALEVVLLTGQPFSQAGRQRRSSIPALWIGLRCQREALYERVEQRVRALVKAGWLEEVRMLLAMGYSMGLPAMSATGYGELARVVRGEMDLEAAIERICLATHAYIRRQDIWFRKERRIHWLDGDDPALPEAAMALCSSVRHNERL